MKENKIKELSTSIVKLLDKDRDTFRAFSALVIANAYLYESRLKDSKLDFDSYKDTVADSLELLHTGAKVQEWKLNPTA